MGRLLVAQAQPTAGYSSVSDLVRIDLTTDTADDLGPEGSFALSPSGGRLVLDDWMNSNATVYEADGRRTSLTNVSELTFVGEDLYCLAYDNPAAYTMASLQKVSPDGALQTIAEPVSGFTVVTTTNGPFIVLSMRDDVTFSQSLLDVTTLAQTPLPDYFQSASPNGRWLLLSGSSDEDEVLDRSTGAVQAIDTSFSNGMWRPGHDEYWMAQNLGGSVDDSGAPALPIQIWQPGTGTTTVAVATEPTAGYYRGERRQPVTVHGRRPALVLLRGRQRRPWPDLRRVG